MELITHNGQLRIFKPQHILWEETKKAMDREFWPGIKGRKVRQKILKMEVEEILSGIDEEIKIIMRPVVRKLWAYTHDVDEAVELYDDMFPHPSIRDRAIELIKIAFDFWSSNKAAVTQKK